MIKDVASLFSSFVNTITSQPDPVQEFLNGLSKAMFDADRPKNGDHRIADSGNKGLNPFFESDNATGLFLKQMLVAGLRGFALMNDSDVENFRSLKDGLEVQLGQLSGLMTGVPGIPEGTKVAVVLPDTPDEARRMAGDIAKLVEDSTSPAEAAYDLGVYLFRNGCIIVDEGRGPERIGGQTEEVGGPIKKEVEADEAGVAEEPVRGNAGTIGPGADDTAVEDERTTGVDYIGTYGVTQEESQTMVEILDMAGAENPTKPSDSDKARYRRVMEKFVDSDKPLPSEVEQAYDRNCAGIKRNAYAAIERNSDKLPFLVSADFAKSRVDVEPGRPKDAFKTMIEGAEFAEAHGWE